MVIIAQTRSQARVGWYSVPFEFRTVIIAVMLQFALIHCSALTFIFSLSALNDIQDQGQIQPWGFLGALLVMWYYFGYAFFFALNETSAYPWFYFMQYSLLYGLVWIFWGNVYLRVRTSSKLFQVLWVLMLPVLWEPLGVGWNHVGVMFTGTVFKPMLTSFGILGVALIILLGLLHRYAFFMIIILLMQVQQPIQNEFPVPTWLRDIAVAPEGVEHLIDHDDKIMSAHVEDQHKTYNASVGWGDVKGYSFKRHLVPVVESGFTPGEDSRLMSYKGHTFLVLVCYDALFSDIYDEMKDAEAIVIVSNLKQLDSTPMPYYFSVRAQYLQQKYQRPVIWFD